MRALSQTSRPLLVSWGARALYVGPSFALSAHRNAVAVVAVGLESPLRVGDVSCRTALIEPSTLHRIEARGQMAFLYVDAQSTDLEVLRARCRRHGRGMHFGLRGERRLVELLRAVRPASWLRVAPHLGEVLGVPRPRRVSEGIAAALESPAEVSVAELAARAGLSASRFQHAFKDATGVAFRRFRTWARMRAAMRRVGDGASLTEAALDAGFSSSAHFSAAFRQMFGMAPSRLVQGGVVVIEASVPRSLSAGR